VVVNFYILHLQADIIKRRQGTVLRTPSPDEVTAAKTGPGGWTRKQLSEWGISWPPPKGWRKAPKEKWWQENRAANHPRS
jgi:hypothetical protein